MRQPRPSPVPGSRMPFPAAAPRHAATTAVHRSCAQPCGHRSVTCINRCGRTCAQGIAKTAGPDPLRRREIGRKPEASDQTDSVPQAQAPVPNSQVRVSRRAAETSRQNDLAGRTRRARVRTGRLGDCDRGAGGNSPTSDCTVVAVQRCPRKGTSPREALERGPPRNAHSRDPGPSTEAEGPSSALATSRRGPARRRYRRRAIRRSRRARAAPT